MTTINHECYVSLEVAKLLKEVGFNWECIGYYRLDGTLIGRLGYSTNWNNPMWSINGAIYSAPTIEVAQRWLREVRMYDVFVFPCNGLYFYTVRKYYHEGKVDYFDYPNKDAFDTYEKTLETGIKKALELILEKGE